jgi:hypothetical protein
MHQLALPFVVATQQPVLYSTARPIVPWLPKVHPFRGVVREPAN